MIYDPRVFSFNVSLEVTPDGSTVILTGTVDNLKAKRAAAQDTRNTVGVREVDNRIRVRPGMPLTDARIEDRISRALSRDPYLQVREIRVDVAGGVATLYGTVDTYFEKGQADDVTSRINGVIMVDNNLKVRKQFESYLSSAPQVDEWDMRDYDWYDYRPRFPSKTDFRIKKDIEDELYWSPFVDSEDITVYVDEGEVTLTGTVDSWWEHDAAANNAYEGGAVYVDNNLLVK